MGIIKTFDQYINEKYNSRYANIPGKTYAEAISKMRPGDYVTVIFPNGIELEYTDENNNIKKFICVKLNVRYINEPDHRKIEHSYYEPKGGNAIIDTLSIKDRTLTQESQDMVDEFLNTHKCE